MIAANVTKPVIVFVPLVLRIAPFGLLVNPRPLKVIGSVTAVNEPESDNSAPDATLVEPAVVPRAVLLLIATTPVEIVVLPVYVLAFDNVNVLAAPTLTMLPAPVIVPLKLVLPAEPEVSVAEPSEIVPAPVIEPTVSETLLRSKVPVTVTADKSGIEPEPESRRVPNEIVVELV